MLGCDAFLAYAMSPSLIVDHLPCDHAWQWTKTVDTVFPEQKKVLALKAPCIATQCRQGKTEPHQGTPVPIATDANLWLEYWWPAVHRICLGVEKEHCQVWWSKTAENLAVNVAVYGTEDGPAPLAKGWSCGMEAVAHTEETKVGNRTVCGHTAWLHISGAGEMWQEKTKQKVCHMTCNNKYCVV